MHNYTGMDITCLHTSSGSLYWNGHNLFAHQLYQFICEGLCPGVHVTSDVITYHCSVCRRRGTIERRLTLLRNT